MGRCTTLLNKIIQCLSEWKSEMCVIITNVSDWYLKNLKLWILNITIKRNLIWTIGEVSHDIVIYNFSNVHSSTGEEYNTMVGRNSLCNNFAVPSSVKMKKCLLIHCTVCWQLNASKIKHFKKMTNFLKVNMFWQTYAFFSTKKSWNILLSKNLFSWSV